MDKDERKPAIFLVICALVVIITVSLYSLFDSPKYNPIRTDFITSQTQSTTEPFLDAVNINTANISELCTLKGIGEKKAKLIIEYREANGKFKTVEELCCISGISEKLIKDNEGRIIV